MGAFLKEQSVERTDCESCQSSIDAAALNLVSGLANIIDAAVASVDELGAARMSVTNETELDGDGNGNATMVLEKDVMAKVGWSGWRSGIFALLLFTGPRCESCPGHYMDWVFSYYLIAWTFLWNISPWFSVCI